MSDEVLTWDGKPVAPDPPHGAVIVCTRQSPDGIEVLLLHRSHHHEDGDWEWTPPSGARYPREDLATCARRELAEETGLQLEPELIDGEGEWAVFRAEVPPDAHVELDSEHDDYEWVSVTEALQRCRPRQVAEGVAIALRGT